jgi:hypothetical protein
MKFTTSRFKSIVVKKQFTSYSFIGKKLNPVFMSFLILGIGMPNTYYLLKVFL